MSVICAIASRLPHKLLEQVSLQRLEHWQAQYWAEFSLQQQVRTTAVQVPLV